MGADIVVSIRGVINRGCKTELYPMLDIKDIHQGQI